MRKLVICDIDGTISKVGDRLKYLQQNPKDWDQFYAHCDEDLPIQNMIDLVQSLARAGYHIVFCTGRRNAVRQQTRDWIANNMSNMIFYGYDLLMRVDGDHRHDTEVKPEMLNIYLAAMNCTPIDVEFILEDRTSMVNKWRELGYTCLQVAEGNF